MFGDIRINATGIARTSAARITTIVRNTVTERPLSKAPPYWVTTSKLNRSMRGHRMRWRHGRNRRPRRRCWFSIEREIGQIAIAEPVLLEDRRYHPGTPELMQRDAHGEAELAILRPQRISRIAVAIFEDELLGHGHTGNDLDRRVGIGLQIVEDLDVILEYGIDLARGYAGEFRG